jgi:hypothetical protein
MLTIFAKIINTIYLSNFVGNIYITAKLSKRNNKKKDENNNLV